MDPISALIMGGFSLLGGAAQGETAKKLAYDNRAFQENMANTSHQREMQDYAGANINPMLAAGGAGAGTPMQGPPETKDIVTPAVNTALASLQYNRGLKELEQTDSRIKNETFDTTMRGLKTISDMDINEALKNKMASEILNIGADTAQKRANIGLMGEDLKTKKYENLKNKFWEGTMYKPRMDFVESLMRPYNTYKPYIHMPFKQLAPLMFNNAKESVIKTYRNGPGLFGH